TTAVVIAFPRSPTVTALTAWDLQSLSKGRFVPARHRPHRDVPAGRSAMPGVPAPSDLLAEVHRRGHGPERAGRREEGGTRPQGVRLDPEPAHRRRRQGPASRRTST